MIYHYKMHLPTIYGGNNGGAGGIGNGTGDGTRQNPWNWYQLTEGQTVQLNNESTSYDDAHRLYLRVKLNAGISYWIGESYPGDGKIWLYDENGNDIYAYNEDRGEDAPVYGDDTGNQIAGIDCGDSFLYTPETTGYFIIGAGSYEESGDYGTYTVAIDPAPVFQSSGDNNEESSSAPKLIYQRSDGFNDFGKAIKYRSASSAECDVSINNLITPHNLESNDSDPRYLLSMSDYIDSSRNAYAAMNGSLDSQNGCAHSSNSSAGSWWKIKFNEGKVKLKKIKFTHRQFSDGSYSAQNYMLSGSNDDENYENIMQINVPFDSGKQYEFDVNCNTKYQYYKLTSLDDTYLIIGEIEFLYKF